MLCQIGGKTGKGLRKGSRVGLCWAACVNCVLRKLTWQAQDLDICGLPARHLVGWPVVKGLVRSRMTCVGLCVEEIKALLRVTAHFLGALLYYMIPIAAVLPVQLPQAPGWPIGSRPMAVLQQEVSHVAVPLLIALPV